ncbi:MAG: hypothetical protein ACLURV_02595 [Gallintestinimicrobium sp.]
MKDFMFVVVSDDGTPHAFSYDSDKRPDGLDQIKSGDRVTVTIPVFHPKSKALPVKLFPLKK